MMMVQAEVGAPKLNRLFDCCNFLNCHRMPRENFYQGQFKNYVPEI